MTVSIFWPVTDIYPGVEVKTCRAGHQDWCQSSTLIVEAAVIRVRHKDSIAVFAHMTDDIKVVVFNQRFSMGCHHQNRKD